MSNLYTSLSLSFFPLSCGPYLILSATVPVKAESAVKCVEVNVKSICGGNGYLGLLNYIDTPNSQQQHNKINKRKFILIFLTCKF